MKLEREYDLVIVGSGGASFCAALAAKSLGKSPVILEKQHWLGGSTAHSGGVWWVPNNPFLAADGIKDSYDKAMQYIDSCVTYEGPSITRERLSTFVKVVPKMLAFIQSQGARLRRPVDAWPDYHDDRPGGLAEGRCVIPEPFDFADLGEWKDKLAIHPLTTAVPMSGDQMATLFMFKRSMAGKLKALKLAGLIAKDKLLRRRTLVNGAAIQAPMLKASAEQGVPMFTDTPVRDFIMENGKVVGVMAEHEGRQVEIRAHDGVLVDAGGFARNSDMRERFARKPITGHWTNANPGETGEILSALMNLGAATDLLDAAIWVVTSMNTDGSWPEGALVDGKPYPYLHHWDISLPHCIIVDQDGRRIGNEAGSYMELGERIYQREKETGRAIPAWTIFDARHRKRYPWGGSPPGVTPQVWIDSGYMKKADTIDELAALCGIDAAGLKAEITRFNEFACTGNDEDFGRGGKVFDRCHGDPTVKPNPNLGAIEQGPFYAVAMYPGDVGTLGGVVTDEYARVKRDDGAIIPGLYAAGNVAATAFGRAYPGAGTSISSAFTFGYIAAHHSAGSNELTEIMR